MLAKFETSIREKYICKLLLQITNVYITSFYKFGATSGEWGDVWSDILWMKHNKLSSDVLSEYTMFRYLI